MARIALLTYAGSSGLRGSTVEREPTPGVRADPVVALALALHEAGRPEKHVEMLGPDAAPACLDTHQLGTEIHGSAWY